MKRLALLALALGISCGGCSTTHDPHAPRTITADANGGQVQVKHGQRLRVVLPAGGDDWRREEPEIMRVIPQAPLEGNVWMFTPVRSGRETLRFVSESRSVTYDVNVP
jgi:hypothetical protein